MWQRGSSVEQSRPGLVLGTWTWTGAICWVSGVSMGRRKGEKEQGGVHLVTGYSAVYMCAEKGSGSCLSKINC